MIHRPALIPLLALACACASPGAAWSQDRPDAELPPAAVQQALDLATQAALAVAPQGARVLASPGQLDPRLRLAACDQIEARLSPGQPAWGRTRVALRCVEGSRHWNIHLPVTVQVMAPAVVATTSLPAGATLDAAALSTADVDWGAANGKPFADAKALVGRVLARPLAAGQAPREPDMLARKWFSAGETVQVIARGIGFSVSAVGQAMSHGLEGQPARVRTEGGRVLVGRPIGERRIEVRL